MGQLSVELSAPIKEQKRALPKAERTGINFPRHFTARMEAGKTPYDEVQWDLRGDTARHRGRRLAPRRNSGDDSGVGGPIPLGASKGPGTNGAR